MSSKSRLIPISYFNPAQEIRISAYADTIVYEQDHGKKIIRAIRFGGYPEMVRALADALYAGANVEAEIGDTTVRFSCETRRFQRQFSHDGIYAEAVLLALDDEQSAEPDTSNEAQQAMEPSPRSCYIFCPGGDRDRLFEELDRKTAVPLIPAYRDYVLDELTARDILCPMKVLSLRENLEGWVLKCSKDDANIISAVEDGLRDGAIRIPGTVTDPNGFREITGVTGYLNTFSTVIAERIRTQFTPLFDPAVDSLSPEILTINNYIRTHAGYPLYNAQLAVAEAVMRKLQKGKSAFIVAECGSGKTKVGSAAMAALHTMRGKPKTFNIVLSPSHVAKKWVREIAETLPNAAGVIVRSITDLDRLYGLYEAGDKSIYAILSKEKARDGYMKRPAVLYAKDRDVCLCPDCHSVVEAPYSENDAEYLVNASLDFFRKENRRNHKCPRCDTPLWTTVNPHENSNWAKIADFGWVYRPCVDQYFGMVKNTSVLNKLQIIAEHPTNPYPVPGAHCRYPLSTYIKRRYKGKVDGLIVDELHRAPIRACI